MSSKKIIILILLIILLIAMFFIYKINYSKYDDSNNLNVVELVNDNNIVSIDSPLSLNDVTGKNITSNKDGVNIYYKIKLKSNVDRTTHYKILFDTIDVKNKIKNDYIKVLLSDKKNNIIKEYDRESYPTLNSLPKYKDSIMLYSGKLNSKEKDEFVLRMWVSDFYVVNNNNEKFKGKITVYSY